MASRTRSGPISATRFFVRGVHGEGDVVRLAGDDARKMLLVLRGKSGDALEIVDSAGTIFAAKLVVDGALASAALRARLATPASRRLDVALAQAIPKGQKMDFVVEKATELGVSRIVPFAAARTVGEGARLGKLERWRRLAKAAAAQCGATSVPNIDAPASFADVLATFGDYELVLFPWELAPPMPLRERLPALLAGVARVLVAIGPEGGFSHGEASAADVAGARLISLGSRIFRTETAGLVTCSALLYASGDL